MKKRGKKLTMMEAKVRFNSGVPFILGANPSMQTGSDRVINENVSRNWNFNEMLESYKRVFGKAYFFEIEGR